MIKKLLFAALFLAFVANVQAQGTVLWEENFDSGTNLPAGWSQSSNASDGGWLIGTAAFHTSTYFNVSGHSTNILGTNDDKCDCDKGNEILTLPPADLSGHTTVYLLFDLLYRNGTESGIKESFKLVGSKDGGTTWEDIQIFGNTGGWQSNVNIDVSAYAGLSDVRFAFVYNDGGGWLFGAMLDNIKLVIPDDIVRASLTGVRAGKYVEAIPAFLPNFNKLLVGHNVTLAGTLRNNGFPTITSFDVLITRGANTDTINFTNQNLEFGKSALITVPYPVELGPNNFSFLMEITNVNGVGDNDPSDNGGSATFSVTGVEPQPGRKVVIEEGTGTWCQWCPRGAVMMDHIAHEYEGLAIPIAVHNNDPMRNATYDNGMGDLIGGYPGGLVEREADIDPLSGNPNFEIALIDHLLQPAKVIVTQNVELNTTIRKVDVTSSLQFLEELNGDYRIAVVFTEEGVTGSASNYNQVNAYSGGGNGPMGGYESLPSPVPAANMVYNHVARAIVGGFSGKAGSVPANNPAGSVMSYTSTYLFPSSYNIDNMHAITMVIDNSTGQIINAESTPIPFVSTSAPTLDAKSVSVSIAPNPVVDAATITVKVEETADVQIRIVDAFGRVVSEQNHANISGKQFLPFRANNLPNGMYTLVATAKGEMVSRPFVIAK
ncbi:MAG: Omp28-related outer membrane protein [Lewinellaceae bacterium]|nr:Omp28-related outer membrane protein [Saprospiraceae bacterium]MCB9330305.1 Omp28-related outer membrane protein [Lewinellaceae bacterium]